MTRRRFVFYTVLFTASLVACATSSPRATGVISAGQVDIQLPPGWKVTSQGVQRPALADTTPSNATVPSRGPVSSGGPETTAIPLAKEDPMTAFFAATTKFSQCLKNNGVKFIGVPDAMYWAFYATAAVMLFVWIAGLTKFVDTAVGQRRDPISNGGIGMVA